MKAVARPGARRVAAAALARPALVTSTAAAVLVNVVVTVLAVIVLVPVATVPGRVGPVPAHPAADDRVTAVPATVPVGAPGEDGRLVVVPVPAKVALADSGAVARRFPVAS